MSSSLIRIARAGLAVVTVLAAAPGANASIVFYQLVTATAYTQTGDVQPATPSSYVALEQLGSSSAGDFTGASFSGGGTAATTLSDLNGVYQAVQSYSTQAALTAAIPNSTIYTFSLTGGSYNGQTATVTSFASNEYPATVPYLTGTTFNSLQNANAANAIELTFNYDGAFGSAAVAINNSGGGNVYEDATIPAGASSILIPANTLQPGTSYSLDLSDLAASITSGFTPAATGLVQEGDITVVNFTTAPVPLPPAAWLLLSGIAGIAVLGRMRRALS
jgi:hypothetical protein